MEIIKGSARKPVSTERLVEVFERDFASSEGVLYVGYPVLSTPDEAVSIDALLISRDHGVVAINLVEGKDADGFGEVQDDVASLLDSKFKQHKSLRKGRKLLAEPSTLTYAPLLEPCEDDDEHRLVNDSDIVEAIKEMEWESSHLYEAVLSVIQSISTIRRNRKRRANSKDNSHGAALQKLEDSIANLDALQSKAVIETVEGVQRIRGLAGSGKTIVLALKAAYLHSQNPDWKIAVTFNTRSLKEQFVRLIETFVVEQTGEQPNENISVINAWGAPGGAARTGIYYQFCTQNGATYFDFQQAKRKFGYNNAFSGVTAAAMSEVSSIKPMYDAILIDEAQDFDPTFLQLCYNSLTTERRLVYAYDELQSLTDASLPGPEEIFGSGPNGKPLVTFDGSVPSQDIILEKCYRNSRPVLASAHALGFGIYREPDAKLGTGLTQMFDRAELWTDVGYEVLDGELADDHKVTLARSKSASPEFLESPGEVEDLIHFGHFDSVEKQAQWVAAEIEKNLTEDELRPEDIIVINPDPFSTPKQVGPIRKLLFDRGIPSHLAGVDTSSDVFFQPDEGSVAFTGIFRAKGNEAGMVYVINAQDCYSSFGEVGKVRNRLFTAMTRSKAWVRVVGHGENMQALVEEYKAIKENDYRLEFVYPNAKLRERLRIVNRDMSSDEKRKVKAASKSMSSLVQQLAAGDVQLEDLPEGEIQMLRKILSDK
ncbi:helicase [Sulfitobacter sp. HI0082]|uniref:DEAD/DEAH box helicase n=1 Tax=uncultured Sulfitobacter sp. TaxID=191468 RepID=UPI0007CFBF91|nr:helicase [Sulfitobacter sp. HI0082]|tara:strand:- start:961 stop:3093 length:2133 start_codon:yes stop_codon:yes gene_type:complete